MTEAEKRRQWFKRAYWNLRLFGLPEPMRDVWMVVVTVLVVVSLVQIDRQAGVSTKVLCALRSDLDARIVVGKEFLKKYPHGTRLFTASSVRVSIANSRRTRDTFDHAGLECPRDTP